VSRVVAGVGASAEIITGEGWLPCPTASVSLYSVHPSAGFWAGARGVFVIAGVGVWRQTDLGVGLACRLAITRIK
jgi:hypothetical protein